MAASSPIIDVIILVYIVWGYSIYRCIIIIYIMEKHIFKFGEKSWAIVVPKAWVEQNKIDEKNTMRLYEDAQGNLVVSARSEVQKEAELFLDSKIMPGVAARWVGMYYRQGAGKLRVYVEEGQTGSRQFEAIAKLVGTTCPGFEVISRSQKEMVLEDFTDIKQVTFETVMSRFKSLIDEELSDMQSGNLDAVAALEDLVNRFFMLGVRYLSLTHGAEELNRFKIFQLLETISDQINILSRDSSISKNRALFEHLIGEFDACFKGLEGDYISIKRVFEIRDSVQMSVSKLRLGDLQKYLVIEIAKNLSKIAELGLDVKQNYALVPTTDTREK